jgi:hypothetical protein
MKALILCNDFPPLNSIGAQRPYSWYIYFKKYGIDVTVITKNWSKKSATVYDVLSITEDNITSEEITEYGTIIRVQRFQNIADILFVKYGDSKFVLLRKFLSFLYKIFSFAFFFFDKHRNIYSESRKYLQKNKVDYVITTGEPFILFKYGYLLRKKFHIQWIADYRDGWYHNHKFDYRKDIVNKILRIYEFYFEKRYIKKADFLQTVDPLLAGKLSGLFKKEVKVIYNGFNGFYNKTCQNPSGLPLILTHIGTVTLGQRVEYLLDVICDLDSEGLISPDIIKFNFIGVKYDKEQTERITKYGQCLEKYINYSARVEREETLKISAESDFLLNFTQQKFPIINAKTYDYFSVKRPILVIPGDNSILSDIIVKNNAGYVFESSSSLKQFILDQLKIKKEGKSISDVSLDESLVSFYTREKQTEILCNYLLRSKNVLILAYDFAPLNTIGAQRPLSWYSYFKNFGLNPTVVTRHWDETISLNENYFRKSEIREVQSLEVPLGTIIKAPYSPNLRDIIIFKYGVDKFIWLRKLLTLVNNLMQFYFFYFDNKSGIFKAAKKYLKTKHFDLIIATGEPFILFRYAYKLNKKYKIPWIADYRDGWSTNYNVLYSLDRLSKFLSNRYFRIFEKKYVKTSSLIITTANPLGNDLKKLFPEKRLEIVYNGYFEELYEELHEIKQNSMFLEIAYCGTIYPYQKLEMFLKGFSLFIKERPDSEIKISFYGIDFKTMESKRVLSFSPEINKYINIYDTLPQIELLKKLKKANVLLLLGNKNYPQINAKIFEYIASNRRIMLVENDQKEMLRILKETNSGLWCENEKDVKNNLITLYQEFLNNRSINNKAGNYSIYSRRNQAKKLAEIILNQ